jgi:GH24 family phage-related lysozyme (muramidase)
LGTTPGRDGADAITKDGRQNRPNGESVVVICGGHSCSWPGAFAVFQAVTIPKFTAAARDAFPGFDNLDPNCQGALVSLVFNRGASMKGDRRIEMRAIKDLVPHKDYAGIAQQFRQMKRLWMGTDIEKGMSRRRDAEADLVLKSKP